MARVTPLRLLVLLFAGACAFPALAEDAAENPFELAATPEPRTPLDAIVLTQLQRLGIAPAHLCSDAVFVRRVYLDLIGTLPNAGETKNFLQDRRSNKRALLIDRLLQREEYADYWAMKWSDLLRVKAEFPINLWPNAAQAYHRWIYAAVRDNVRYDAFARELLTASGSNFRVGPVNFYRAMQNREPAGIAQTVALTFLGARADKWPAEERAGLAGFFTQVGYKPTGEWKEEIVFFDPDKKAPAGAGPARFPGGAAATLVAGQDPREVFAAWLVRKDNPWFARALVNRAWSWLLGRGIIHEPDDIRADNPPVNPELLAYLEHSFVQSGYDLKKLFRLIANSQVYQLSAIAGSGDPAAEANFACYAPRRLEAEVLIDALNQITGGSEKYSSAIPEPFTFIPDEQRSIALPDGSITSSFLETFGRPPRDTGFEEERNNRITAPQRLHLLNSTHVQRKIEQSGKLGALFRARGGVGEVVDNLYLTILSRLPTDAERQAARDYAQAHKGDARTAAIDLTWALINSTEFLYRH